MTITFDSLPFCVRLECISYLRVQDLGRLGAVSKQLNVDVSRTESLWKELYPLTFTRDEKELVRKDYLHNLINRPYRRDCIGWSVSVLQPGSIDVWLTGSVIDFRSDLFLIRYDVDNREIWERETITSGLWHTQGKLRMRFLSPPSSPLTTHSPQLSSKSSATRFSPISSQERTVVSSPMQPRTAKRQRILSSSTCASSCTGDYAEEEEEDKIYSTPLSSPRACLEDLVCTSSDHHSWRCEAFRDRTQAPTKCVAHITDHSDEVLCVSFSHDGRKIASCSRDGTTRVYEVIEHTSITRKVTIQHRPTEVPCRVIWSSDDSVLLVCSEAKNGNIFDYDATVAAYNSETGARIFSRPNIPFDVCACWVPGTTVFIHGESLTVSPRGTYHQVLAMFDVKSSRVVGRFHFRFNNEAFVHLINVSPDGNFLALTCGLGDGLSDMVRVVRIPDLARAMDGRTCFEIRVPRHKFTHESLLSSSTDISTEMSPIVQGLLTSPITPSMPIAKLISIASPCGDGDNVVPSFFCGGAVLGLCWSRDSRNFYTNTRLYRPSTPTRITSTIGLTDRPDLDNTLEIQQWSIQSINPSIRMRGAHGFTTKDCPFYLFISESPCGEYVASGSEDCGVYLYHVRHGKLLRILSSHSDVVSMVTWRPQMTLHADHRNGCLLASASDDHKICLWSGS